MGTASDPDRDLVRALAGGDPSQRREALGRLYERHREAVFTVAWRVTGHWDAAQDVTQEVFLHLAQRVRSWRGEASLAAWLYRVTVNRAIDARRREARRPAWRFGPDQAEAVVARSGRTAPAADQGPADDEEAARVREALALVPPNLRAVLVLRYLEGLSYAELARVLSCSLGTVKSRLHRAHAALAAVLGVPPRPRDLADRRDAGDGIPDPGAS